MAKAKNKLASVVPDAAAVVAATIVEEAVEAVAVKEAPVQAPAKKAPAKKASLAMPPAGPHWKEGRPAGTVKKWEKWSTNKDVADTGLTPEEACQLWSDLEKVHGVRSVRMSMIEELAPQVVANRK